MTLTPLGERDMAASPTIKRPAMRFQHAADIAELGLWWTSQDAADEFIKLRQWIPLDMVAQQGLSIVGHGTDEAVSITPGLRRGKLSPPYRGKGQSSTGCPVLSRFVST